MLMPTVFDNEEGERSESDGDDNSTARRRPKRPSVEDALNEEDEDRDGQNDGTSPKSTNSYRLLRESQEDEERSKRTSETEKEEEDEDEEEDAATSAEKEDSSSNRATSQKRTDEAQSVSNQTGRGESPLEALQECAEKQDGSESVPCDEFHRDETAPSEAVMEGMFQRSEEEGKELLFSRMLSGTMPDTSAPPLLVGLAESRVDSLMGTRSPSVVPLAHVPFTRDIDLETLSTSSSWDSLKAEPSMGERSPLDSLVEGSTEAYPLQPRRATVGTTTSIANATYKVAQQTFSNTWQKLSLPEPLSSVTHTGKVRRYPNTPLAIIYYEHEGDGFLLVGLVFAPTLLKVILPKHHEPDRGGRFNTLPVDNHRFLLADESSHQVWLVNTTSKTRTHLAGCGKRGYLDGPLETCRMHSPCSLALDPHSHHVYVADKGNHVIRKLDLLSGLASTVVGSGCRGNCDGTDRRLQALDSPFEVSFAAPHHLVISCADNAVRSFDLRSGHLKTLVIGA